MAPSAMACELLHCRPPDRRFEAAADEVSRMFRCVRVTIFLLALLPLVLPTSAAADADRLRQPQRLDRDTLLEDRLVPVGFDSEPSLCSSARAA